MRVRYAAPVLFGLVSGCVGPLVPVVSMDEQAASQLRSEVRIYLGGDMPAGATYLGPMTATSCMNKLWDRNASPEDAINQLLYKSRLLGGNAVTSVLCGGSEGTTLSKNCWNSVTCHAVAIRTRDGAEAAAPEPGDKQRASSGSGTGFFVNGKGLILTAAHVVDRCRTISAVIGGAALPVRLVQSDAGNDLAILQHDGKSPQYLKIRAGRSVRAGDEVVAVGFPLRGLLADQANITAGSISALAGLGNDTRYLQITSPVQPGNSGGPLLDRSGLMVGVVVSKLDAMRVAKLSGDIPQNVNFALNARVALSFLEAHSAAVDQAVPEMELSIADVGDLAKRATVPVICER